jgi:hypothetical protein
MKKILFALSLSLAAAGCAEGLGPALDEPELTFMAAAQPGQAPPAQPQITVAGEARGLRVDAVIATPDVCRTLTGSFQAAAPADEMILALTVRISPTGTGCHTAVGRFAYAARVEPVPAGRQRVQVWHQFEQTGNPNPVKVFDDHVWIP